MVIPPLEFKYQTDPQLRVGKRVPDEVLLEDEPFQAPEGTIQLIYGRIRQGKSTEAVRRMYESLSNGRVVYSNIDLMLDTTPFDDRIMFSQSLKNLLFFKKRYYKFLPANFHCFNPTTGRVTQGNGDWYQAFDPEKNGDEIRWLNSLTDCEIYYDEGQWLLDSYEKTYVSIPKRKLITESGHCNRTIVLIAQRTQSIHVNARGNVNQFFRCQKVRQFLFFTVLQVEEFQDMVGTDVDESEPITLVKHYSSNKYWNLFNTHYLRAGRPKSQDVNYYAYDLNFFERLMVFAYDVLYAMGLGRFFRPKPEETPAPQARVDFSESLGVKPDVATIKNGERLNTIPVGGSVVTAKPIRTFKTERDRNRHEFFRNKALLKKQEAAELAGETLPF